MNCPFCQQALLLETVAETEVDRCPGCKGVWLDTGEGEALTCPVGLNQEDLGALLDDTLQEQPPRAEPLDCPRCGTKMWLENFAKSSVEIDRCKCGVWLDAGELEKIQSYRRARMKELGNRTFRVNPAELERLYARMYFDRERGRP